MDIGSEDTETVAGVEFAPAGMTIPKETSYKKSWWQTAAALVFLLFILSDFILGTFSPYFYYAEYEIYKYASIPMVIGWLLLIRGANNIATRVAAIVFVAVNLIFVASDNNCLVLRNSFVFTILLLMCCYAISLIMNNNEMCSSNRVWCNYLPVLWASTIVLYLIVPIAEFVMPRIDGWSFYLSQEEISEKIRTCRMSSFMYFRWFNYIRVPLYACAMWMLARSEAFTGNYDKDAACDYSPVNKYAALALIAPAIVILSFIVMYIFYDAFPS